MINIAKGAVLMKNYVDPNTVASNPGSIELSRNKFDELRDDILNVSPLKKIYFNHQFKRINQYLLNGDTQPALVVSTSPLIISAYSEDMDAVVFLRFPNELVSKYNLKAGMRLITVNIYFEGDKVARDIKPGKDYSNDWVNFVPMIPLFLCDNEDYILNRTEIFDEQIWSKVERYTEERAKRHKKPRKGFYYLTKFNLLFLIF